MPVFLVFLLILVLFIFGVAYFIYSIQESQTKYYYLSIVFVFLGSCMIYWLCKSWNQDIDTEDYHCIRNIMHSDGSMTQQIFYDRGDGPYSINITQRLNRIFPNNTIVKVSRYKTFKNGIWWMTNDSFLLYEAILPNDENYEDARKLVKDIKIVDEEIIEPNLLQSTSAKCISDLRKR